jgi:hypothetical protein
MVENRAKRLIPEKGRFSGIHVNVINVVQLVHVATFRPAG